MEKTVPVSALKPMLLILVIGCAVISGVVSMTVYRHYYSSPIEQQLNDTVADNNRLWMAIHKIGKTYRIPLGEMLVYLGHPQANVSRTEYQYQTTTTITKVKNITLTYTWRLNTTWRIEKTRTPWTTETLIGRDANKTITLKK